MNNLKVSVIALIIMVLAFGLIGCGQDEDVIAEVNGAKITESELDQRVEAEMTMMGISADLLEGPEGKEALEEMRKYVLQEMIMGQLFAQKAEELGVAPSSQEAQEQVDRLLEPVSDEEYQNLLDNMDWDDQDFNDYIYNQLLERAVYEHVTEDIVVSEEEITEYFNENRDELVQVRASHILVQEKDLALEIIASLEQGEDFAELAQENSIDPGSGAQGGDLGYFTKEQMVPEFSEAAFNLEIGEYTAEPVASEFGFHIILVEGKKDSVEDLREEITHRLTYEEKAELFDRYITDMKDNANIVNNQE